MSLKKDLAGNRRRITCSNPKKIKKSRKNGTPGSPGQNSKTQRGKEEQHARGGRCQHCTSHLHFTDDVPQHFKQPDRNLHPASACIGNAHRQDRRHLLTKPAGITFFEMHVLSEPSGVVNNQKSKNI